MRSKIYTDPTRCARQDLNPRPLVLAAFAVTL
jgi:hypothetical protein